MKVRNAVLALSVAIVGAGMGCESVQHAASVTTETVTGDKTVSYNKTFEQTKDAVDKTTADLKLVIIKKLESKDKDGRPVYTVNARTTEDKKIDFIATFVSPEKTNVVIDTSAFSGNEFRKQVEATLQGNLK